jgi:hypothetical protein
MPLIVIFTRAAPEPVHSNGCGPLPEKVGRRWCSAELAQGLLPSGSISRG